MKLLGLIGGASPQSTLEYYQAINRRVNQRLGQHYTAKILLMSIDFQEFVFAMEANRWELNERLGIEAATLLNRNGVIATALCCNTLHFAHKAVRKAITNPFLHILDPVVKQITQQGLRKVALLGTQFTMEHSFHRDYLSQHTGVTVVVPSLIERQKLNAFIYNELCYGIVTVSARETVNRIAAYLIAEGAQAIILGCTELPLLYKNLPLPDKMIDTVALHTQYIADFILDSDVKRRYGIEHYRTDQTH